MASYKNWSWGDFVHPGPPEHQTSTHPLTADSPRPSFIPVKLRTEADCKKLWKSLGTGQTAFENDQSANPVVHEQFNAFKLSVWEELTAQFKHLWYRGIAKFGWHLVFSELEHWERRISSGLCQTRDTFCYAFCVSLTRLLCTLQLVV